MAKKYFQGEEIVLTNLGGVKPQLPVYNTPLPNFSGIDGGVDKKSVDDIFSDAFMQNADNRIESIPLSSISTDKRYPYVFRGSNPEEMYAQQQTVTEKAFNDTLKFTNLVGTTIAGGLGMVYGAAKFALPGGKFSDIFDNEVMNGLDDWNKKVDNELLPNYYKQSETDAEWYSTDNWVSANFLFDKVFKNSAYAFGAMLSGNVANSLAGAAGAGVGEWAAARALAAESSQAFKMFTPMLRSTARAFSAGKNIEAAQVLTSELSSIADASLKSSKLFDIAKQANKFAGLNDFGRKTVIAAYSSAGEASFEALNTSKHFREKLINDYFYENGTMPTGDALDKINAVSNEVGVTSFLGNMALLSVTEFNQLKYLMGSSYRESKRMANSLVGEADDVMLKESQYAALDVPSTARGKFYQKTLKTGKNILTGKSTYLFDSKEALQEMGQYALEVGAQNYYNKAYKGNEAENIIERYLDIAGYGLLGRDEEGEGVGALISKEGIESGIIGGLTGGVMQAKRQYAEAKQRATNTNTLIEKLNTAPSFKEAFIDKMEGVNRGVQLQKEQEAAIINGDKVNYYDSKTDLLHNYLAPRVKFGKFDMIMEDLNELKQMGSTEEGLASLKEQGYGNINDDLSTFNSTLSQIEQSAKTMSELYSYVNLTYGGQIITDASGKEYKKYSNDVLDKMVYSATKIADYDKRIPLVSASLLEQGIPVGDVISELMSNPESDALAKEIQNIDALDPNIYTQDKKDQLKRDLLETVELALRRKKFISDYNDIINKPENYKADLSRYESKPQTEDTAVKETIKVNTKAGEREVEIGEEYFLGKVVEYSKTGQETFRAPIIQVLAENENGTIKVKDVKSGDVFDVSKETLEDYKLGKVSNINPKNQFILDNWNTLFKHKGIKVNGQPAIGRIENHPAERTLFFVYKNEKGEVKRIPVKASQFAAQGDYKQGMISPAGKLVAAQEKSLIDLIGYKEETTESEIIARNNFLSKLYEDGVKRINAIEKSLSSKRDEVEKISKKLEDLTLTKSGAPRKRITSTLRQQLDSLAKLRASLEQQIEDEQSEKEELEYTVVFFKDMVAELSEFKEDNSAFIDKLNSDVNLLEDLIDMTGKSIDDGKRLLLHIDELLGDALDVFNDYIKRLKEDNPTVPLFLDDLISNLERFLGDEGTRMFIEQRQGMTSRVLELEADINDFEQDLNIPELSAKSKKMIDDLKELSEGIDNLIGEQIAKRNILEKFQKFVDEKKQMEEEESKLSTNKKFKEAALKTEDTSTLQTKPTDPNYEPNKKKAANILPVSTVGIDRGKPHQTRAKVFGANLSKFKDVYSVYINLKNEDKLGLSGMIDLLRTDEEGEINESVNPNEVLALVMVNSNGELLGESGLPLTEEQLADAKNHAIFQVKPDSKFKWKNGESMFRKGTPQTLIDAIVEKYTKERKELLNETEVGQLHTVAASFGIPQYEITPEGEKNYDARNSVESTNLIGKTTDKGNNALEGKQIITVPTVSEIESQGLTAYTDALGKPFLQSDNAVVPLVNKKHTEEEATVIYEAILQLSKYAMDAKEGINKPNAKRLLNYLRSVVYWGIPKDTQNRQKPAGYNSIFFETNPNTGKLTLTISNQGYDVVFTPTEIERNRGEIIDKIKNLHNNINSALVKKINQKFEQITSISSEGTVESITWPNYQSYLLSDRMPDKNGNITTAGKPRSSEDIPLTTTMRKVKNEDDINREGIYFYTTDTADDYSFEDLKNTKKQVSKLAPGKVNEPSAISDSYVLDDSTRNKFTIASGDVIYFTAPDNVNDKNAFTAIKLDISKEVLNKAKQKVLAVKPELEESKVLDIIVKSLKKDVYDAIKSAPKQAAAQSSTQSLFDRINGGAKSKPTATTTEEEVDEEIEQEETAEEVSPMEALKNRIANAKKSNKQKPDFREIVKDRIKGLEIENWNEVEAFIKQALPTVPFYRVKNMIQATNGKQAWGMLQDGAIYVYENAEVGTAYHEVFEAIWKMFSSKEEQQNIIDEFKSRKGTFVDRPTGNTIKYSQATPQEIKEQLAEEFRDYVQYKKVPVKPADGRPYIVKLFSDIVNAIKAFFLGPQAARNTEELFKRIGEGYYAKNIQYETNLSYANQGVIDIDEVEVNEDSEFREKLNDREKSDIVDEMIYTTMLDLFGTNKSLFTEIDINKNELYPVLKANIENLLLQQGVVANELLENGEITEEEYNSFIEEEVNPLVQSFENDLETIFLKYEEKLMSYGIEFDENDQAQLTGDERSKETGWQDATKIDSFRKSNRAIKLLLATLPRVDAEGYPQESSIGGHKLLPVGQVYVSLLNNLSSSKNVTEMISNLKEMAKNDANYRTLYKRITKQSFDNEGTPNFDLLKTTHELQLITSLWKSVKKYNSAVMNVNILDTGEVNVSDAPLSTVANQLRAQYMNGIVVNAKQNKGFFVYDKEKNAYVGNPLKAKKANLTSDEGMISFLKDLDIQFTIGEINNLKIENPKAYKKFKESVFGIRKSILSADPISKFTASSLSVSNRLLDLALIKAKLDNPAVNSTHYNINGDLTQSYIGPNSPSELYEFLLTLPNLSPENFQDFPQYAYLLTDSFVEGSVLLDKLFTKDGSERKESDETDMLFKVGYVGGLDNDQTGKRKQSSNLTYKERLIQEINLNLKGWYLNLVPGDSSLEHMVYMSNAVSSDELLSGMNSVNEIFKKYFMSELKMAREDRPIANVKGRSSKDLRFFKDILADETKVSDEKINKLHNDIINEPDTKSPEEVYKKYEKKINAALDNFITNDATSFGNVLLSYNILKTSLGNTYSLPNTNMKRELSKEQLVLEMKSLSINYMIANIEFHKLLYSDPYQYSDELKRIKSFNAPRQLIVGGQDPINNALNQVWNDGYEKGDIGFTDWKAEAFKTVTLEDVDGIIDLPNYDVYTETDGSGINTFKAHRQFRVRAGEWNDAEEKQYRYDVAWEKRDKGIDLSPDEQVLLDEGNPQVQSAYVPSKPIVSGNKGDGNTWNDIVVDKFALYPLSYRVMKQLNPDSNAVKLYNKMQNENIDYVVFSSGRKVGALNPYSLYKNGEFNDEPFVTEGEGRNVVNVPFEIISVQTEVPSKEKALVTRGSQITKLITMDFMNAGIPIDFELKDENGNDITDLNQLYTAWYSLSKEEKLEKSDLYREILTNQNILKELINQGYQSLLSQLGITETKDGFLLENKEKAANTLRREILKREVNDNISKALNEFFANDVVLESTPAYQQIRNILYSIADREVISQKISGGMKVQIPSTLLESVRADKTTINGKEGYTSDVLKFYENEDGKRVCEIMVARWFKSDMSDADLLEYLNNTPEGQKILSGIAFRIPTQKQNSIDAFVIKQFLPKEFGDSVVVPAALVAKVGSDFDIDKLSIYFKNVFNNSKGELELVEYKGSKESTMDFYSEEFDKLNKEEQDYILRRLNKLSKEEDFDLDEEENLMSKQEKLNVTKKDWLENIYKQSLENEYIQSSERLVTHPMNFDRLIQPNSADQLKGLGEEIARKTKGKSFDYKKIGNMLSRTFMSNLRHAFVTGKYAIGIAAVSQTNNSLNQRQPILIDTTRIRQEDSFWMDNGVIKFKNYNKLRIGNRVFPTLSFVKNTDGQDISDIIGQFMDGYLDISKGPWIMELGATPNVASTWMFLAKLGVPIDEVAYFMNQPIIRDYLKSIENAGYSYLFIDDFVNATISTYTNKPSTEAQLISDRRAFKIPSKEILRKNVGRDASSMSIQEREQQKLMLYEFLKYAKMGENLFQLTQGTNFDTSNFNDPYLVSKKELQLQKANETIFVSMDDSQNIVPAANALLENSFLGELAQSIYNFRNAFSETDILLSDNSKVRPILQNVLSPYMNMRDRDFVKVAQKVVNDFFDWIVQTKNAEESLNLYINDILIKDEGILPEILSFVNSAKKESHPLYGNEVISLLEVIPSSKSGTGGANNIKVKGIDNKVYDQNNIIYAFREIRDYLGSSRNNLYERLVLLSMVQSGLSNSPISFSSVLPYEDFQPLYNSLLSKLQYLPGLNDFYELGVFQKNNWNNDDIVPNERATYIESIGKYNPAMEYLSDNIKNAIIRKQLPYLMTKSVLANSSRYDYITYSWEVDVPKVEKSKQKEVKEKMRKAGDYSFIKKGLFKKVKNDLTGKYLIHSYTDKEGVLKEYFVYKAVNAWGESYRANEFYDYERSSIIENGMIKTPEYDNRLIIDAFSNKRKSLSERLVDVEYKSTPKIEEQPATPESLSEMDSLENEYMYEPFTYEESNFDAYDEPNNSLSLPDNRIKLKDGKFYTADKLNTKMLISMGYSVQAAGKIIKNNKC